MEAQAFIAHVLDYTIARPTWFHFYPLFYLFTLSDKMLQSIWLSLKCFDVVPAKNGSPLSLFSYWTLDGILQIVSWNIKARNKNKLEKSATSIYFFRLRSVLHFC